MASLVTVARYQLITLDTTSAASAVSAALETAEDTVEEYLRRPLPSASREETVRFSRDGRLYPAATPVLSVEDGLTIVPGSRAVAGASPDGGPWWPDIYDSTYPAAATITYTGGFTATTLPRIIENAIAWLAHQMLHVDDLVSVPAGATSARVGDVAVSFAEPSGPAAELSIPAKKALRPYRRRFV